MPPSRAAARADRALASSVVGRLAEPGRSRKAAATLLGRITTDLDALPRPDPVGGAGAASGRRSRSRRARPRSRSASRTPAINPSPCTSSSTATASSSPTAPRHDVVLPPSRSTTVRVAVETRGSGQSPRPADGHDRPTVCAIGQQARITVRSSFVSGVGVFLTVGAIVFLAIWWGWDIHRRREAPRHRQHHPSFPDRRRRPDNPRDDAPRTRPTTARHRADFGRRPGSRPSRAPTPPKPRPRSSGRARSSRSAPRCRASPGSCASPRIAYALGVTTLAGTYSYANEAPNIVYELLLGGVLTATLVPLFVKHFEARDDDAVERDLHRVDASCWPASPSSA